MGTIATKDHPKTRSIGNKEHEKQENPFQYIAQHMTEQCHKWTWTFKGTSVLHYSEPNNDQKKTNEANMDVVNFLCIQEEECRVRDSRSHDKDEGNPVYIKPAIL